MRRLFAVFMILGLSACAAGSATGGSPGIPQTIGRAALVADTASSIPVLGGCQMFPAPGAKPTGESWFNVDISKYKLDPKSASYIASLPGNLHPDFGVNYYKGETPYGIPINIVPANQKLVPVKFVNYASSSNPGPYPIPPNAQIEGEPPVTNSGDRHVLVLQSGVCKIYEMWQGVEHNGGKNWTAANGAVFNLKTGALRPAGWTSADAAGLPITPALITCSDMANGAINHAVRVTFNSTFGGYVLPATHHTSGSDTSLPPMGERFRLKASFNTAPYKGQALIILTALKKFGFIVADNGSNWYFQGQGGTPATCFNTNALNSLKAVPGSAFEAVYTGKIHT
jgi:hypothetical protein